MHQLSKPLVWQMPTKSYRSTVYTTIGWSVNPIPWSKSIMLLNKLLYLINQAMMCIDIYDEYLFKFHFFINN